MSLKKYSFGFFVFVMFSIPFSILSFYFLNTISEISKKDALYYMGLRSSMVAIKISNILNTKYDVLSSVRENVFLKSNLEEKKKILSKIAMSSPDIVKKISLADSFGHEIFSTDKKSFREDYSKNPVFKNARYDNISIGAVSYLEDEPPQLIIAEPVIRIKGEKPLYTAIARLSLGNLNMEFLKLAQDAPGNMALIDSGGQIICDSDYSYLFSSGLFASEPVLKIIKMLQEKNLDFYKDDVSYQGSKYLLSISRVKSTDWFVYELVDESKVIDHFMYGWAKKTVIIGFLLIAFFSFISYKLAANAFHSHK